MTTEIANSESIQQELKTLEEQSKQLSKQIGAAKKAGADQAYKLIEQKKRLQIDFIAPLKKKLKTIAGNDGQSNSTIDSEALLLKDLLHPRSYPEEPPKSNAITIVGDGIDREQWDDYVERHPQGSIYQKQPFLEAISQSFGHSIKQFVACSDGAKQITGLIVIVEQNSPLFGHFWTSIPFVNYGGAIADSAEIEKALLEAAKTHALSSGASHLELRGLYQRPCNWSAKTDKASMWLPLPNNSDTLWNSFKAKLRSQIKRGLEQNVRSKTGGTELLNDFYAVFSRNMRDLGTPVYQKSFFSNILNQLKDCARIIIIYVEDTPVAAAFLIKDDARMEIPWASTIRDYNSKNINMVLYWHVLRFACDQQCKLFDFGRSSIGAGTYKFKKQWGAKPVQHYWYVATADNTSAPSVNPDNPKYKLLIAVWQRLPVWLANLIGPHVVKYIP